MQYKLVGYRETSFKGEDGNLVQGYSLYMGENIESHGQGYSIDKLFVLKDKCPDLELGKFYDVQYKKTGRLHSITKI